MKKKLLFLTAALAVCLLPLTSCSKDDEPPVVNKPTESMDKLADSEWSGYELRLGTMTLTFESDGHFLLWLDKGATNQGSYKQDGKNISFNAYAIGTNYRIEKATLSEDGKSMSATLYSLNDFAYVTFTRK